MEEPRIHTETAARRTGILRDEALTREILGAFFAVHRALGHGYLEAVYANSLAVELGKRGVRVTRESAVTVWYAGEPVGTYRVDMLVEQLVVVELKASRSLSDVDRRQLLNYLRCTNLELGLLLNFGDRPRFLRLIHSNDRKGR